MLDLGTLRIGVKVDNTKANQQLKEIGDSTNSLGSKVSGTTGKFGKLSAGIKAIGGVAIAASAAAATAVVAIGKKALESYADYEQLTGGIETLFKESSDQVMKYAENAYKTSGLSANEYMDTVTSFSASLLQSLDGDTAKAAEKADLAITDMSDNANKMGTSMESIQNAYQGFAKQNYTMLDNLKLGYGGTKEEMQRLLNDAEKISGQKFDLSNYADIVDAIHVVQTEMGITGTTAKEAATTISGSFGMLKSSWENLLVGFADNDANLDSLIDNVVSSAETVLDNVLPVINTIAGRVAKYLPVLIEKIASKLPDIIGIGITIIKSLIEGIISALPDLIASLSQIIAEIVTNLLSAMPRLIALGAKLILALIKGFPKAVVSLVRAIKNIITKMISTFFANLGSFKDVGIKILKALWEGFKYIWKSIINWVAEKIKSIINKFKNISLLEIGKKILNSLWNGLKSVWSGIAGWIGGVVDKIKNFLGLADEAKENKDIVDNPDPSKPRKSHRIGLSEVPYDNYAANLHKGEMVLTQAEAQRYKKSLNTSVNNYTVNFNGTYGFNNTKDIDYFMEEAEKMIKRRGLISC